MPCLYKRAILAYCPGLTLFRCFGEVDFPVLIVHRHDIPLPQFTSAAQLHFSVHFHMAIVDQHFGLTATLDNLLELEKLV